MPASAARGEGRARHARVEGHFGELLQGLVGGEVALVTLPCPRARVTAHWRPGGERLLLTPGGPLPGRWARRLAVAAGRPRGRLAVAATLPPGAGAGTSTGALAAAALAMGLEPGPRLTRLMLAIEGASDPQLLPSPARALWASRRGRALGAPLPPLPRLEVLGGFAGPPRRTDPRDARFAGIDDLVADWRRAGGDRAALGRLATESARRNQRLRGGPDLGPLLDAAREAGALGIAVAHTGSARALLFAPGALVPARARAAARAAGLSGCLIFGTGG